MMFVEYALVDRAFGEHGLTGSPGMGCDVVSGQDEVLWSTQAFQSDDGSWRVRLAAPLDADQSLRVRAAGSDAVVPVGAERIGDFDPDTDLSRRGALSILPGDGCLRHADGSAFLWLADTWWYGLSDRISDDEFEALARQRADEGFSAVQICAGYYPEAETYAEAATTNGHLPTAGPGGELDLRWWSMADARVLTLVESGLVPVIVGGWSYHLDELGQRHFERHWREVVARWATLPVVWMLAGEQGLPWYDHLFEDDMVERAASLKAGWNGVGEYLAGIDPMHRPITSHPCPALGDQSTTDAFGGRDLADFVVLQTGHADRESVAGSLDTLTTELGLMPRMPVLNSEVCYEGIMGGSHDDLQRLLFWTHMCLGAAGHTYGAQGLWAFRDDAPVGPGQVWGDVQWRDAASLPGARQLGVGAAALRKLPWESFVHLPDGVVPSARAGRWIAPMAAGTDDVRVHYFPSVAFMTPDIGISLSLRDPVLAGMGESEWELQLLNPRTGDMADVMVVRPHRGEVRLRDILAPSLATVFPTLEDWVVVTRKPS